MSEKEPSFKETKAKDDKKAPEGKSKKLDIARSEPRPGQEPILKISPDSSELKEGEPVAGKEKDVSHEGTAALEARVRVMEQTAKRVETAMATLTQAMGSTEQAALSLAEGVMVLEYAFNDLNTAVREGAIRTIEDLKKAFGYLDRAIAKVEDRARTALEAAKDTPDDSPQRKDSAEAVRAMVQVSEALGKSLNASVELARTVQSSFGPMAESNTMRRFKEGDEASKSEGRRWFLEQVARLETRDGAFQSGWETWPLINYLGSIQTKTPEQQKYYEEMAQFYEDVRRLHDVSYLHGKAAGMESVIEAAAVFKTGVAERILQQDQGVAEGMVVLQELCQAIWFIRERAGVEKDPREKKKLEAKIQKIKTIIGGYLEGRVEFASLNFADAGREIMEERWRDKAGAEIVASLVTDFDDDWVEKTANEVNEKRQKREFINSGVEDNEKKQRFTEQMTRQRRAGRIFIIDGHMSDYDLAEFAGGDFFVGRVKHYGERLNGAYGEICPELIAGFDADLYTHGFEAGLWNNISDSFVKHRKYGERGFLSQFGMADLRRETKEKSGRRLHTILIQDAEKFSHLDLREFGTERDNFLAAQVCDAELKADKFRSITWTPNDKNPFMYPTIENLQRLRGTTDHLKGENHFKFYAQLVEKFVEYWKEPTLIDRVFKGKGFIKRVDAVDPKTGKKKLGIAVAHSSAENRGLGNSWDSGNLYAAVMDFASAEIGLIDRKYAEHILRKKLTFLGIPGIGPIRDLRCFWDEIIKPAVSVGGLLSLLLAMIGATLREIGSAAGIESDSGGKRKH